MNFDEKIFSIGNDEEFEAVALELFRWQAERCMPYRQYIELLGIDPQSVKSIEQSVYLREGCGMTYDTPHRNSIYQKIHNYTAKSVASSLHIENFHILSQGLAKHFH